MFRLIPSHFITPESLKSVCMYVISIYNSKLTACPTVGWSIWPIWPMPRQTCCFSCSLLPFDLEIYQMCSPTLAAGVTLLWARVTRTRMLICFCTHCFVFAAALLTLHCVCDEIENYSYAVYVDRKLIGMFTVLVQLTVVLCISMHKYVHKIYSQS